MAEEPAPRRLLRFKRYEVACDAKGRPIPLGQGGMGVTYKAHDPKLDCTVVLKIVGEQLNGDEASIARFRREARKLAQLRDHPHIATLFDFDEEDGKDFYVMEFIDGEDLSNRVRRLGPLSVRDALIVVKQVASALTAIWARNSVHRDIKPANIMVLRNAGAAGLRVKLIDFGLAKDMASDSDRTQVTQAGMHGGMSVYYASPEQIKAMELDTRSDIYSLGVTLWFLLTGNLPFAGTSVWDITNKQLHEPPTLSALPAHTPPAVRELLSRMLAKKPEDRPAEPTEVEAIASRILEMLPPDDGPPSTIVSGPGGRSMTESQRPTETASSEAFRPTEAAATGAYQPTELGGTDEAPGRSDASTVPPKSMAPAAPRAAHDTGLATAHTHRPGPLPPMTASPGNPALAAAEAMRGLVAETTMPVGVKAERSFETPVFTTSATTRDLERGPSYRWPLIGAAALVIFGGSFLALRSQYRPSPPTTPAASTGTPAPAPRAAAVSLPPATPEPTSLPTPTPVPVALPGITPEPTALVNPPAAAPAADGSFANPLGMRFVPLPDSRAKICVHETRVGDFAVFRLETGPESARPRMLVLGTSDWVESPAANWRSPGFAQTDQHPVVGVSWDDAVEFCKWLTARERASGAISASQRYRLPTDLEWSKAVGLPAEPGATPKDRDSKIAGVFPWGTEWPLTKAEGNYRGRESVLGGEPKWFLDPLGPDDGFARTSPVMSFPPNALGIYDLGGNAWEWCEDYFDSKRNTRTLRGASWSNFTKDRLLSSFRLPSPPGYRQSAVGFRVVLAED